MGKPFNAELARLISTIEWARTADVSAFANFLATSEGRHLCVIGSGGSFTAVELTKCLVEARGGIANSYTPLAFIQSNSNLRTASILIFTAGGNNSDVLAVYDAAVAREAASICILVGAEKSKIQRRANEHSRTIICSYKMPAGRDGYLATNSLAAFVCLAIRASGNHLPTNQILRTCLEGDTQNWEEIHNGKAASFYLAIFGGWARPAVIDLESKFSEAGLAGVMPADYRSFAHGRHNWIDKCGEHTVVVAFLTPDSATLAERTLRMLPKGTRILHFATDAQGPSGSLELILKVFKFTAYMGNLRSIDPGRPGVPAYGSRLYHLGPVAVTAESGLRRYHPAVERKLQARHSLNSTSDMSRVLDALASFNEHLQSATFGALVVDFDGTLADHGIASGKLHSDVSKAFTKLLRLGIPLYIATGRGDSIHNLLEESFPNSLWSRLFVSYYNGALTLPLTQSAEFASGLAPHKDLDSVFPTIAADAHLREISEVKVKHSCQITVKAKKSTCPITVFNIVKDYIAKLAPTTLRVVQSSHSIDVIPIERTKINALNIAKAALASDRDILSIGDRGFSPGNDFDLLTHRYSLSVDEVSTCLETCWNLLPHGKHNVEGLLEYVSWMKSSRSRFSLKLPMRTSR